MKLTEYQVTDFRSVRDSGPISVRDVTCLVGKNEAGKTALLEALYRLNPIVDTEGNFDPTDDYPRKDVEDYKHDVESGARSVAQVVRAAFQLSADDVRVVEDVFGTKVLRTHDLELTKYYNNSTCFALDFNESLARQNLAAKSSFEKDMKTALGSSNSWEAFDAVLDGMTDESAAAEKAELKKLVGAFKAHDASWYAYNKIMKPRVPLFLYFDEYYQMKGHENIQALLQRQATNTLEKPDHPLLGLIKLARLDMDDLMGAKRTAELNNKLEGAGNHLTRRILQYWSQNRHIQMKFDVREARPEDPEGMRSGTNIWGRVYDAVHWATTELGSRSRGFLWFFSFLAWYEEVKRTEKNLILLLDEPGLTLHGRAQGDLLRYIEEELSGGHQVLYTTHSPFMVDAQRLDRVRIVQDRSIDAPEPLPEEEEGTKVTVDVLEATADSLFPLQGALGYDIQQSLFIGPNSLVVEGASDLIYLREMSALLEREGRTGLSPKWVITPTGGSSKVSTFVALLAPQSGLNIVTLIDFQKSDKQEIENLYKSKLLQKANVLTYADFTGTTEADIEDMFARSFYLELINGEYKADLQAPLTVAGLNKNIPRVVRAVEEHLASSPLKQGSFSHYRRARYFADHAARLSKKVDNSTKNRFEAAFTRLNAML